MAVVVTEDPTAGEPLPQLEEERLEAMKVRFDGEFRRNLYFHEELGGKFFGSQRSQTKKMKWGLSYKGGDEF